MSVAVLSMKSIWTYFFCFSHCLGSILNIWFERFIQSFVSNETDYIEIHLEFNTKFDVEFVT